MIETTITCGARSYFQPILVLTEMLLSKGELGNVTSCRTSFPENGYSRSIILLLVVALESYIGRIKYLKDYEPQKGRQLSELQYLTSLVTSDLQEELTEMFVLRDVIAHGHVWELSETVGGQDIKSALLRSGYGDGKFNHVYNSKTKRSRRLDLNLVPSAIGVREVFLVFTVVQKTLEYLVTSKLLEPATIKFHGRFRRQPFDFWSLIPILREESGTI